MVILDVVIALILDVRIDTSTHSWCVLVVVAPVVYIPPHTHFKPRSDGVAVYTLNTSAVGKPLSMSYASCASPIVSSSLWHQ